MDRKYTQIKLGLLDKVDECLQPSFSVDLGVENLAVFGNKFSGKSTLLKSIIIQIHNSNNACERIVILDFSHSLLSYGQLPLVYGYFLGENEESIKRCLSTIEEIIKGKKGFADALHYTFIIDGIDDLFLEGKYERHQETFTNILRKKVKERISIIFTSYHSASGVVRLLQFFDNVIAFDLPKEKYEDLFPKKVEKPMVVSGRGVARKGESAYEFQAYYPFGNKEHEVPYEKNILFNIRSNKMYTKLRVDKIKSFADELTETEYLKLFPSSENEKKFVSGVDYVKFEPIKFDLHDAGVIALYGTNFEDKLNLIQRIIFHAKKYNPNAVVSLWDDSRSRFKDGLISVDEIIENSKSFEAVFTPCLYDDIFNINKFNAETGQYEPQDKTLRKADKFTIYIIQNSRFFNKKPGSEGTQFAMRMCHLLQDAATLNYLFLFTNIKPLDSMLKDRFNPCIKHAFLCGDIFQFIDTRGRSSVFGDLDPYELKQDFSRTVQGDGFYLDDESDYPQKIKFIVASEQGGEYNDRNS